MIVDWDNYSPYVPPHSGPLEGMARREARESFRHLMDSRGVRREELLNLLSDNGVKIESDGVLDLQRLDDWYRSNVEPSPTEPARMRNLWYSVSNDVGLVLEAVVKLCAGRSAG